MPKAIPSRLVRSIDASFKFRVLMLPEVDFAALGMCVENISSTARISLLDLNTRGLLYIVCM